MEPPTQQIMSGDLAFDRIPGVVVRQDMQVREAVLQSVGLPYESRNRFKISILPDGRHAASAHGEAGIWRPSSQELKDMPQAMRVLEESSCLTRYTTHGHVRVQISLNLHAARSPAWS
jgi:hypothetical protein